MLDSLIQVKPDVRAILILELSVKQPQLGKVVEKLVKDHAADHNDNKKDVDDSYVIKYLVTDLRLFYCEHGDRFKVDLPFSKIRTCSRVTSSTGLGKIFRVDRGVWVRGGKDIMDPMATGAVCSGCRAIFINQAVVTILITFYLTAWYAIFPVDFFGGVAVGACSFGYLSGVNRRGW